MQKSNRTETVGASRYVGACCNLGHRPQFETVGTAIEAGQRWRSTASDLAIHFPIDNP